VSRSTDDSRLWDDHERRRLRAARKRAGHTEAQCATILVREYGVKGASQSNVSRWESGKTGRPGCIDALIAYADAHLAHTRGASTDTTPPEASAPSEAPLHGRFLDLARDAADEPLLGPTQRELVHAMIERLRNGPPLSAEDRSQYADLAEVLRLRAGREPP
jgi:transcriptional regulator with XRE-family HTH domain